MAESIEFLTSSQGSPVITGLACFVFVALILAALHSQSISLGSMVPKIKKSENPGAFWSVVLSFGLIATWMGLTTAMGFVR